MSWYRGCSCTAGLDTPTLGNEEAKLDASVRLRQVSNRHLRMCCGLLVKGPKNSKTSSNSDTEGKHFQPRSDCPIYYNAPCSLLVLIAAIMSPAMSSRKPCPQQLLVLSDAKTADAIRTLIQHSSSRPTSLRTARRNRHKPGYDILEYLCMHAARTRHQPLHPVKI